jgi:hypothetical protein
MDDSLVDHLFEDDSLVDDEVDDEVQEVGKFLFYCLYNYVILCLIT